MAVKRARATSRRRSSTPAARARRAAPRRKPLGQGQGALEIREIESIRSEIDRLASAAPPRWNADPDEVRRSVIKLVLTLVEFIRQVLERQAIRRMEAGTLAPNETESVGLALMRLEETVGDLCRQFDLKPEDLTLDLGPVGKLI